MGRIKIKNIQEQYIQALRYKDWNTLEWILESIKEYYLEYSNTYNMDIADFSRVYNIPLELSMWVLDLGKKLV